MAPALLVEPEVVGRVVAQGLGHRRGGLERAQVERRAHPVRAPELDVVGVVVRLDHDAVPVGIPGLDA